MEKTEVGEGHKEEQAELTDVHPQTPESTKGTKERWAWATGLRGHPEPEGTVAGGLMSLVWTVSVKRSVCNETQM